jgi:hypothetical protein
MLQKLQQLPQMRKLLRPYVPVRRRRRRRRRRGGSSSSGSSSIQMVRLSMYLGV